MRTQILLLAVLALLLAACATPTPAVPSPTPRLTDTPTLSPTPSDTPTPTPTPPPPTNTPTSTPTQPITSTPSPTPTQAQVPLAPTPTSTPTPLQFTTPPTYDDESHPIALIASYYNAINRKEYERAYGYWEAPSQSYEDFAAGFADTAAVRLVVGPPAVPPSDAAPVGVPVLLMAWHTDGSENDFYGCFYVRQEGGEGPSPRWRLHDAIIHTATKADIRLLQHACDPLQSVLFLPKWDQGAQPVDVIFSYYNAIVNKDYQRAYNYWESPPQSYDDFVAGFADTASAFVALIPPEFIEGAMGSQYAAIPTFIIARQSDGSEPTFAGCFATRRPNPEMIGEVRPWRIYSATVAAVPNNSTDAHILLHQPAPCQ